MYKSLSQYDTKTSSSFETRINVVKRVVESKRRIKKVCSYYHVSRSSVHRWVKRYDGTDESLMLKSHKPHSIHPKSVSAEFVALVLNKHRRCPDKSPFLIWVEIMKSKRFKHCFMSVLRVLQRNNAYKKYETKPKKNLHTQVYDTPEVVGIKWQMDVKHVPKACKSQLNDENKYYQYTVLDEHSRERYLYFSNELSMYEVVNALIEAIEYFGYIPNEIQTDNGFEFTDSATRKEKGKNIRSYDNLLEKFCKKYDIVHHLIRPRTPEHNGKVERSHRIDQEYFYDKLKFYDLEDLRAQGQKWNKKYNHMPKFILNFKSPHEVTVACLQRLGYSSDRGISKCVISFVS